MVLARPFSYHLRHLTITKSAGKTQFFATKPAVDGRLYLFCPPPPPGRLGDNVQVNVRPGVLGTRGLRRERSSTGYGCGDSSIAVIAQD